jgi:hypothetical protein
MRPTALISALWVTLAITSSTGVAASAPSGRATPTNIDVSQRPGNESEEAIAVNPTNPKNIVMVTNVEFPAAGMFEGVTFDGGKTWTRSLIGNNDNLLDACCDPSLSFDRYGNLFMGYLFNVEKRVPIALSTDGGLHFHIIAQIQEPAGSSTLTANDRKGLFRFVDQPTITTAENEVWIVFNGGGPMVASGATVTGLGQVGAFSPLQVIPGTNNCTYGDVAIGPRGQVMNVCALTESGVGGGKLFVSLNPTGIGGTFGDSRLVVDAHVGGFDYIPTQPDRSVDSESGLAWDRTGGPHSGRVYLVYTAKVQTQRDGLDIMVSHSDDLGQAWSAPVRVNDDTTLNSHFLSKIALDPTSGNVAVVWYDCRNDVGQGGPTDPNGLPNDDAQFWGAFSTDGGQTFSRNIQISAGTSNSHVSGNHIDFGDYSGLAFYGGIAYPAWADNSNSTGSNPDGTLHQLDVFTAAVPVSN